MAALCIVLELVGWILPIGAAVFAYFRMYPAMPNPKEDDVVTYGNVERWMKQDIPELFRSRKSALKWPALVAAFGLTCSTVSSILSILFL